MGTYADKIFESIKKEKYSDRVFNQINQELSQKQQNNSQTVQRPNSDLHRTNAEKQSKSGDKVSAVGDSAYAGLTGINANIMGAVKAVDDFVWGDLFQRSDYRPLKPIYDYYLKENERAQAEKQSEIENGNLNPYVDALVSGTVQAVPTAVLGAMSGGTSLAGQAATAGANLSTAQLAANTAKDIVKNPNFIYSAVQTFGGTYEEAKQNGADTNTAIRAALLNAIPQSLIEVSGGTEKLVAKLANKTKGLAGDVFKSALEEGLEEVLQYPVEGIVKKTTYAPETPIFSTKESAVINPKEMAENFAVGASVGGILGGASAGTAKVFNTVVENNAKKQQELQQEQLENRAAIAQAMKMGIVQDISGKYNYSRIGSDGTVRIYSDVFQNVEPEKQRSFIKQYAQDNYITQFDNTGKIIGEDKGITIKSDNSRVYITPNGINEVSKKIRGGNNIPFLESILELPAIIENSELVEKDIPDEKGRPFFWNKYKSKIYINKKPYTVSMKIKNPPSGGNRYYYHTIDEIKIESEPSHGTLAVENQPLPNLFSDYPDSSNPTIPQKLSGVNTSIRENSENMTENRQIRVSESELKVMKAIAKNHKIPFEIMDLGVDAKGAPIEGKYENGVIYVSPYAKKPSLVIFKHELTHYLEKDQYRYEQLLEVVRRYYDEMGETLGTDYAAEIRKIYDNYRARGEILEDGEAERELIANFAGKYLFTDEKAIQYLVKKRPNIARSIVNWIREQIAAIKGDAESELLIRAERMYLNALKAADKRAGVNGKSKYSFGGENAKTANISALNDAKSRIANGEYSETVRQETGWFKGYDGKWRFEIDDSQAEFRPDGDVRLMQDESYRRLQELTEKWADDDLTEAESEEMDWLDEQFSDRVWEEKYRLDDYLDHPKLYEAYPMLRFTSLVFDDLPLGEKGFYNPKSNTIVLSRDLFGKQKNTLLHEIQHIIQKYEGFAKGSSPKYWSEKIESGYSKIDENGIELMPSDLYRSTAGEIEARDVSNRLDYTSEQRKNTRPDIDRTDVVFADGSTYQASVYADKFGEQIDNWLQGKMPKDNYFDLGTTSPALVKSGAEKLPLVMPENVIYKFTTDYNDHSISLDDIKRLPYELQDPVFTFKGSVENSIVALTEITDKSGNEVIAAIHLSKKQGRYIVNRIASVYGKNNIKNYVLSQIEKGNLINPSTKKASNWFTTKGLQLPEVVQTKLNALSNPTIPQEQSGVNTSISENAENDTKNSQFYLSDNNSVPLEQRVSGDNLLDAQDLIDTVKDVGAKVDGNGYITVYHRTNNQSKEKILSSGQMTAKEDGIFFSTKKDGQNAGYGSEIIEFKIPAEKLMLDDIFDDEAHLRLPLKRAGETIDVKPYLTNDTGNSQFSLSDDYDNAVEQYGAIPPGENPARDVKVPKQMNDDTKVRRTVRTAMEASGTPSELVDRLKVDIANDVYDYKVVSDKSAVSSAKDRLDKWGFEKCYQYWKSLVNEDRKISKNDLALAEQMYIEAAHNGDFKVSQELMVDIAEEATRAGQNAQSIRLLKNLTPEGRIYKIDKLVYRIQKEIDRKTNGKAKTIKVDENLKKRMLNAKSQEEMDAIEHMVHKNIAKQMPEPTKLEKAVRKWNEWRYLAMLGNPRTHIRNIFGNALFAPMVNGKNAIGIALERTLSKDNRTKARLTAKDKAAIEFAKSDFDTVNAEESKSSKNKYNESLNGLDVEEKVFKNKALEWARKTNSNLLEWEDTKAKRKRYSKSFAQFIKARGWDYQNLTDSQLDSARNYAMREAKRATFQDTSEVANALNKLSHQNIATEVLVEGLLPFKKTPINILKRGVEYSPFGIAKGIKELAWDVKKGNMNASQAIDTLSCGLSGTAMMMVGVLLSSLGVLTSTSDDDKEGEFDKLSGNQEYALQFFGKSYTIDWIAPLSMPLFIGVEIENAVERGDADNGAGIGRVLDALTGISDPMFNLSMLQGINSSIKTVRYSDNPIVDLAANTVSGYLGQGIPTILGQTARTVDTTRRNSYYTPEDSASGKVIDKTIKKTAAKIPGVSMLLEPYIDKWGNEQVADNWVLNAFENFASPGYYSENTNDSVTEEMARLYKETSDTGVVPRSAKSSLSFNGNNYRLTEKEYTQYQKTLGKASHEQLQKLINSTAYSNMSNEEKAVAVGKMYRYAEESAKVEFYKGRGIDFDDTPTIKKFNEVEESGVDLYDYLYAYVSVKDMESDKNASGETIRGSLKRKQISCMVNQLGIPAKTANKIYDLMH